MSLEWDNMLGSIAVEKNSQLSVDEKRAEKEKGPHWKSIHNKSKGKKTNSSIRATGKRFILKEYQ